MNLFRWLRRKSVAPDSRFRSALIPFFQSGRPAAWADDPAEQVRHFRHWVFAAVRTIANRVAATPLCIYRREGAGLAEVSDPSHPAVRLFSAVNPFHTRYWLWSQTITFLELTGNAYWYIPRNGLGAPAEIWVCPSQGMRVLPDSRDFIAGYEYSNGGRTVTFARDEIIHLRLPNPADLYYGQGPLQAAAETVDGHEAMKCVQRQLMRRGAWPGGVLESDSRLDDAAISRLRAQMETRYAGADNAGKWLVLEAGLKAREITLTPSEMAFAESAQLARDEILAIFGVPAAVIGLSQDVNRAVADAMDTIFARYCVAPLLQLIGDQLNQDLMPRFDPALCVQFESPVPEDRESQRRMAREDFQAGLLTRNEARAEGGYEQVARGDRFYVPANRAPERE